MYGTVHHHQGHWFIRCEPQVKARLKRVFPRAPQHAADVIAISDTPENSRDLLWFLDRYPMEVAQLETLAGRAQLHRDQELRLAELLERRAPPPAFALAEPPREYQAEVPAFLDVKGGLLLGDDVGLGKTVSAICCLQLREALPAVVVAPPHLCRHWMTFIKRFSPTLAVYLTRTGKPEQFLARRGQRELLPLPDVIVTTYHRLRGLAELLSGLARLVIFDECQQLRSGGTQIHLACQLMATKVPRRLGLSATPIYNYGSEFFSVVDVLQPGALGSHAEFIREWCRPSDFDGKARLADPTEFGAYLRREGIMLRRTRRDVGREMPRVSKILHQVQADAEAFAKLEGGAVDLAMTILRANEAYRGERMRASAEFDSVMRQATGIAKAPYVAEFVRLLVENGEQVILFGWHRAVYEIWLERLKDLKPVLYTGSESPRQKAESEDRFRAGDAKVFIMSLRSGAGVDGLQFVSRTCVFGELDWSPGVHEQCVGRLDRDGQSDPVTAYFLIAEEGADPIMVDVLGIKLDQLEGVRNPGGGLVERVDTGENNLRALARAFLAQRGVAAPASEPIPTLEPTT
jgi:SNF2 family DNA or RNA helicase